MSEALEVNDGKIACELCGSRTHAIRVHLRDAHPEVSEEDYKTRFPEAPLMSPVAIARLAAAAPKVEPIKVHLQATQDIQVTQGLLHEVFKLGSVKAAKHPVTGAGYPVQTFTAPQSLACYVPDVDSKYVFPIDLLKTALMAFSANIPLYLWGMAGTGKSTILEQVMAHTGRPWLRVQHTRNTEESHIVGQWTVKDGQTVFELGPLAFAMKYGLTYCADEYDFAMPSVTALYQPVLEGKALLIKEADEANRIIRPHPLFRFCATGNTNGTGDDTGLYQGTLLQNAANYERFGVVEEVKYIDKKTEIMIVMGQAGVVKDVAEKLVNLACMCREAFAAQKISLPPSPRAVINAAKNGLMRGDFAAGFRLAYVNRLPRVDQEAVREVMARVSLS